MRKRRRPNPVAKALLRQKQFRKKVIPIKGRDRASVKRAAAKEVREQFEIDKGVSEDY